MSFTCNKHSWQHLQKACPYCQPDGHISTTDSTKPTPFLGHYDPMAGIKHDETVQARLDKLEDKVTAMENQIKLFIDG